VRAKVIVLYDTLAVYKWIRPEADVVETLNMRWKVSDPETRCLHRIQ
jgi:hypothetical protein